MKTTITKSKSLQDCNLRLDAGYHLSEGQRTLSSFKEHNIPTRSLSRVTERIFYGGRARRVYVKNADYGLPFIKGADIIKADFSSLNYISRKRTANLQEYFLKEEWTVLTRSGTIGKTAFVNKDFIGKAASDDIIRVVPKNILPGFLYAFLSSKHGRSLVKNGTYGAVIQHIEPEHIENLPVPIFPPEKQQQIHDIITQSAELRVAANRLLKEAVNLFEKNLPVIPIDKTFITSIDTISKNNLRLDSTTNYASIQAFYKQVSFIHNLISIENLSAKVFTPNIFKRMRVNNPVAGVPFLSGSDLLDSMPRFESFLSKKMRNLNDYILKNGWIAIQDSGTIGYVSLINGFLDGVAATNNLVRIIPNESDNANPYIFTFLNTKQGQQILKGFEYGSVQKHIDNNQVCSLLVPIIPEYKEISDSVSLHLKKVTESCLKENQAIQLVEKEIDQWQQ